MRLKCAKIGERKKQNQSVPAVEETLARLSPSVATRPCNRCRANWFGESVAHLPCRNKVHEYS